MLKLGGSVHKALCNSSHANEKLRKEKKSGEMYVYQNHYQKMHQKVINKKQNNNTPNPNAHKRSCTSTASPMIYLRWATVPTHLGSYNLTSQYITNLFLFLQLIELQK